MNTKYHIIVSGGLNTDIIGLGVERIIGDGELTLGGNLQIGPGGKARNMAQMCAVLLGEGKVTVLGRTVRDPYGLWKVPVESLERSGVNTEYLIIQDYDPDNPTFPGIALIPVDRMGNNQIYVLPGINLEFSPDDVFANRHLFIPGPQTMLLTALEIPLETVLMSLVLAESSDIRVILDPGGIDRAKAELIKPALHKVFLIKPNEFETSILTGKEVIDFETAEKAAGIMLEYGVRYVFITHGAKGGYLFGEGVSLHIPVPEIELSALKDATGCGDQAAATITAALVKGYSIEEAARLAVKAGTLQFNHTGIHPVTQSEIF